MRTWCTTLKTDADKHRLSFNLVGEEANFGSSLLPAFDWTLSISTRFLLRLRLLKREERFDRSVTDFSHRKSSFSHMKRLSFDPRLYKPWLRTRRDTKAAATLKMSRCVSPSLLFRSPVISIVKEAVIYFLRASIFIFHERCDRTIKDKQTNLTSESLEPETSFGRLTLVYFFEHKIPITDIYQIEPCVHRAL